jgi:GH24 family phage-related lysozyme (muramidase)
LVNKSIKMTPSDSIITYIKSKEGLSLTPYYDQSGWTIGYGHFLGKSAFDSIPSITQITQQQADDFLTQDLVNIDSVIDKSGVTLTQNQYDALTDFGMSGVHHLQIVLHHLANDNTDAAFAEMNSIIHGADGSVIQDLVDRRTYEIQLFNEDTFGQAAAETATIETKIGLNTVNPLAVVLTLLATALLLNYALKIDII